MPIFFTALRLSDGRVMSSYVCPVEPTELSDEGMKVHGNLLGYNFPHTIRTEGKLACDSWLLQDDEKISSIGRTHGPRLYSDMRVKVQQVPGHPNIYRGSYVDNKNTRINGEALIFIIESNHDDIIESLNAYAEKISQAIGLFLND